MRSKKNVCHTEDTKTRAEVKNGVALNSTYAYIVWSGRYFFVDTEVLFISAALSFRKGYYWIPLKTRVCCRERVFAPVIKTMDRMDCY